MKNFREAEAKKWTDYYNGLDSFMQPNEYLLKLLLGNYKGKTNFLSGKKTWREAFLNLDILDMSCGDGRNITLFEKLGFNTFATEISDEICDQVFSNLSKQGLKTPRSHIKTGFNNCIPFDDNFFDFLVSWNALYYLDHQNQEISENLTEVSRVLKRDGYFLGSIPGPKCYSLIGAEKVGTSQIKINPTSNNNWGGGLQKGTFYYSVESKEKWIELLSTQFYDIEMSELYWDGFGSAPLHYFIFIAKKK